MILDTTSNHSILYILTNTKEKRNAILRKEEFRDSRETDYSVSIRGMNEALDYSEQFLVATEAVYARNLRRWILRNSIWLLSGI